MKRKLPAIGISMGDPAGVGPELCLKIIKQPSVTHACVPVIFGDRTVLEQAGSRIKLSLPRDIITWKEFSSGFIPKKACVVDCGVLTQKNISPGRVKKEYGNASYAYIRKCASSAMKGLIDGMTTCPINKESLRLAGVRYAGHTEILKGMTSSRDVCMMMTSQAITVSLVTTHLALKKVPSSLSRQRVATVIDLTVKAVKNLGKKSPLITVCGLNCHAGEHGLFGHEEKNIIEPAIRLMKRKGLRITGPIPPDTAFIDTIRERTDAYVVMYHDQGLIPFKMLSFHNGVNVTLGLPIVRTSVDHGTAFDIAWKGKASAESLIQAVLLAVKLACH